MDWNPYSDCAAGWGFILRSGKIVFSSLKIQTQLPIRFTPGDFFFSEGRVNEAWR